MNRKAAASLSLIALLSLAGCATYRGGPMMGGAGHGADDRDMGRMCDMHRQMTQGKSPAEQKAAVEAHIASMHGKATSDMVAHHFKMVEMHCGAHAGSR
jgi:hypothetical protein